MLVSAIQQKNLFRFGANTEIELELHSDGREDVIITRCQQDGARIYYVGDSIDGSVVVRIKSGKELKHKGIRIELCGTIEQRTNVSDCVEFLCIKQDLARPGILSRKTTYPFKFTEISMQFESYSGAFVDVRYFLRVRVNKVLPAETNEYPIVVHRPLLVNDIGSGDTSMTLFIKNALEFEVKFNKERYHLYDVIEGQMCFLLVGVKVKSVEIEFFKRESFSQGLNFISKRIAFGNYEVVDGDPSRAGTIPFRLFLGNYPLSPTILAGDRNFAVHYYLKFRVCDEKSYTYAFDQELILYRKKQHSDGISQSCTGDNVGTVNSVASTPPQISDIETLNEQQATEVHSGTDSGRVESRPTSDETDRPLGDCPSRRESADEVGAGGAMEEDVFASAEGKEAQQDEQARQTSDSDLSAAVNTVFIGDDNREAVAALQTSPTGNTEAENSNNSDIDEAVLE